jgi:hypothetical protein
MKKQINIVCSNCGDAFHGLTPCKPKPKPAFPAVAPTLDVSVTAKLLSDMEKYSNGSMAMTMVNCDVTQDGGEKIGWIGADPAMNIYLKIGSRLWQVSGLDLFKAAHAAEEATADGNRSLAALTANLDGDRP